ncbi:MAG: DUF2232 domain-containing protein [Nitrospinae bacterium]|nr:DUF2232 domain-containing protein [Nitrospinota bacterium]
MSVNGKVVSVRSPLAAIAPGIFSLGFFFASMVAPPLGLFAPAPLYFALVTNGYLIGALVALAAAAVILATGGLAQAGLYLSTCGLMAMAMAFSYNRGHSLERTLAYATIPVYLAGALAFFAAASLDGRSVMDTMQRMGLGLVDSLADSYAGVNADQALLDWLKENREGLAGLFARLFPGMAFITLLLMASLNIAAVRIYSLRRGLTAHFANHDFAGFAAADWVVWALIAGGAGTLMATGPLNTASMNILLITLSIYLIQGMAILHSWFLRFNIPLIARGIGYFLVFSHPLMMLLISGLGLTDVWVEFRKKNNAKPEVNP